MRLTVRLTFINHKHIRNWWTNFKTPNFETHAPVIIITYRPSNFPGCTLLSWSPLDSDMTGSDVFISLSEAVSGCRSDLTFTVQNPIETTSRNNVMVLISFDTEPCLCGFDVAIGDVSRGSAS